MPRFDAQQLLHFGQSVLTAAGASPEIAADTAKYLLEGDLLGYSTHGYKRLYFNAKLLAEGQARGEGDISVLKQRAAVASWDANFLPGPFVAAKAVRQACDMARDAGTATIVVRRAQHVASLAAYLQLATEQGLLISLLCSTPAQASVAPFGGKAAVFSPNPFAIGVPTSDKPLLLDMSFSMTAAGKIRQYWERQQPLPWQAIVRADGQLSSDPADYIEGEGAAILPLGGTELGYKGYGLCLMSEIWTMSLSNYGRLDGASDGESNALFVQVLDPSAFGETADFLRVTDDLVARCKACPPLHSDSPVRIPGERALAKRAYQLQQGVKLDDATWGRLQRAAQRFSVTPPTVRDD
ncbi:Ldh family oxidoreductase [Aliidiomarina soli]|uniref:Lactate dehydrogenase n=1 Tax=Aliidiomarina soli TaxID=1928574 RepID=A0A432WEL6_9GAMM|nr:Ldh family oxidoreductase [Aliidiomarina soli]RUO31270.1 lactate dehydrogenase [Aliidiomarina soli]